MLYIEVMFLMARVAGHSSRCHKHSDARLLQWRSIESFVYGWSRSYARAALEPALMMMLLLLLLLSDERLIKG
jgi:hypothetical protein